MVIVRFIYYFSKMFVKHELDKLFILSMLFKLFPTKSGGLLVDLPCANPPLASPDMIENSQDC